MRSSPLRLSSTGPSTTSAASTGSACSQEVLFRLPVSQRSASWRSHWPAFESTQSVRLVSMAEMPMPTRISRVPATPPREDSR